MIARLPMRILIDTNVYISYLLTQNPDNSVFRAVSVAHLSNHILLLPGELIDELVQTIKSKPFLTKRIDPTRFDRFLSLLRLTADVLPPLNRSYPAISRDAKDDYLLAHALLAEADILITGDQDLLVLDPFGPLRILAPQDFLTLIEQP